MVTQDGQCHSPSALPDERRPGRNGPQALDLIFGLTLGCYRRGRYHRRFADRVFANRSFADGIFANWRVLDNWLRMREIRSNRCSYQSQRRSANDYKFQHEVPCCH